MGIRRRASAWRVEAALAEARRASREVFSLRLSWVWRGIPTRHAAIASLAALLVLGWSGGAEAANVAAGVMTLSSYGCPAETVPIVAADTDGGAWTVVVGDANPDVGCASVEGEVFALDILAGGCTRGIKGGLLCLRDPVVSGNTIAYGFAEVCFFDDLFEFCVLGAGSLTIA